MWDIIKLQASYRVYYKKSHNYQFFQTLALIPKDELALAKVYISKKPISCIFIIRKDI